MKIHATIDDTAQLYDCPFCGDNPTYTVLKTELDESHTVACQCGATFTDDSDDVIRRWNKREYSSRAEALQIYEEEFQKYEARLSGALEAFEKLERSFAAFHELFSTCDSWVTNALEDLRLAIDKNIWEE